MWDEIWDVIVIGAGMAGIAAARELLRAQLSVVVLEARNRIGGRIWTLRDFCDEPVEAGAEFVHGRKSGIWPEIRRAGLDVRASAPILRSAFNLGGATRWLPWILVHPETWACAGMRRGIARNGPPDLSVREFIEKRGYRGRARILAEMTFLQHLPGGGNDVGVLGMVEDGVLDLQTRRNYRIVGGFDSLPRALADGLDIRLDCPVDAVFWDSEAVRLRLRNGRELEARAAISTLPVGVVRSGTVRFVPPLPQSKQWALAWVEMGPVLKLLLRFQEPFWPGWMEKLECGTGPINLYWSVFRGADGASPVLMAYCTGPRAAELSVVSEQEAAEIAIADLQRLFPKADPRRMLVTCRRIDWTRDPFAAGGYTFLRPGGLRARACLRAADTGMLFWAGAATEQQPIAEIVEAAYRSGLRAAAEVRAALERAGEPRSSARR
ncbi:MAG: FAD-dependent oxidoreductase [Candidatus Rokubacteria bacterium]|nr:FAD-dependent oxidoreductase [Candidatus Rokubacteria bacterium]